MMVQRFFILGFLLGFFTVNGFTQNMYTLKNQNIEFSVDQQGNIVTLKNMQTGQNYASGKPMWRLYFDRAGEKEIKVLAGDNQPEILQSGKQILMHYKSLKVRGEVLNVSL